jgi:hypothetical protein
MVIAALCRALWRGLDPSGKPLRHEFVFLSFWAASKLALAVSRAAYAIAKHYLDMQRRPSPRTRRICGFFFRLCFG